MNKLNESSNQIGKGINHVTSCFNDIIKQIFDSNHKKYKNSYDVIQEIYEEMIEIKDKAIKNSTFMKAPNGLSSNLPEKQRLLVRTKEFKKWFGDREDTQSKSSKIIDENGEPQIMYHGSNKKHISEFKIDKEKCGGKKDGVYFTSNKKKAKEYSLNGTIYESFLNIKNPLILDFGGKYWCNLSFQEVQKLLNLSEKELKLIEKPYYRTSTIEDIINTFKGFFGKFKYDDEKWNYAIDQIVKIVRTLGYDGIIAKNIKDIGKIPSISKKTRDFLHDQVVILNPNQIKATDNGGNFSENNNIYE